MAAAQVAKKLKDKRQKKTIESIFRKVGRKQNKVEFIALSVWGTSFLLPQSYSF